jgi:hypothetical protein
MVRFQLLCDIKKLVQDPRLCPFPRYPIPTHAADHHQDPNIATLKYEPQTICKLSHLGDSVIIDELSHLSPFPLGWCSDIRYVEPPPWYHATQALDPPNKCKDKLNCLKTPKDTHFRLLLDECSPSAPANGHIARIADVGCLSTFSSLAQHIERSSAAPATPTTKPCSFSAFSDYFVHWHEYPNQNQAVPCPNSLRMPLSWHPTTSVDHCSSLSSNEDESRHLGLISYLPAFFNTPKLHGVSLSLSL